MLRQNPKIILYILGAFLLPFLGFVYILKSPLVEVFYYSDISHSILLAITGVLAFYTSYFAYKAYDRSKDFRIFTIALSFYTFGFVFILHALAVPGLALFNEVVFDVTEHFGLFVGALILLGFVLPLQGFEDSIYRNKVGIFSALAAVLLLGFVAVVLFSDFAQKINVDLLAVGPTTVLFALSLLFFLKKYGEKPNSLLLCLTLGVAILINSGIIPFFYEEWNVLWWYFHLVFLLGFAVILVGLIKSQKQEMGFEQIFGEVPLYSRFSSKLIVLILSLAITPLIFTIVVGFDAFEKSIEQRTIEDLTLVAESKEGHLFSYMDNIMGRSVDFSSDGFIRDATQEIINDPDNRDMVAQLNRHLRVNKMALDETIRGINVIGLDGKILASTKESEIGKDESEDDYFIATKALSYGEAFMGNVELDHHFVKGIHTIPVPSPLIDKITNEKIGVLVNYYGSTHLDEILSGEGQVTSGALTGLGGRSETLDVYLVNRDKLMITKSRFFGKDVFLRQVADTKPVRACLESMEQIGGLWTDYRGVTVYGSSMCIIKHGHNWTLVVEMDEKEVLAPVVALKKVMASITLVVILLGVFLAVYFSRRFTKPIEMLTNVTEKIGEGDLNIRAKIRSKDEIGQLAKSFNKMTTDLQKSRIKLKRSEGDYKMLTELSTDCIKTFDLDGNLLFINKEGLKEHRLESLEKAQKNKWRIEDTVVPEDREKYNKAFKLAISGQESTLEFRHSTKGSTREMCSEFFSPIKNENGEVVSVFTASRDITEEKEIDRIKNEFISIASHQLRTPLTGIRWVVTRFMKNMDQFSEEDQEYLRSVQVSSARLTLLVDQLLNMSRIESGGIGIVPTEVNVGTLIKGIVSEFLPISESREVSITFNAPEDKIFAKTDLNALHNIVQSIVSNAVEYTPEGGSVSVTVSKEKETFSISVSDTGIGIPEKELPKLFKKFGRAENAKKFKPGGTGLGLYIVKQAVDLLEGDISLESTEGKGTTFYVNLPLHSEGKVGDKRFV